MYHKLKGGLAVGGGGPGPPRLVLNCIAWGEGRFEGPATDAVQKFPGRRKRPEKNAQKGTQKLSASHFLMILDQIVHIWHIKSIPWYFGVRRLEPIFLAWELHRLALRGGGVPDPPISS